MKIYIPNNFKQERLYIIEIIFSEFLGLDYSYEFYNENNYKINLNSGNEIIIKDNFWSNIEEKNGYLDKKNIPQKVVFSDNTFIQEKNIPIIYGTEECTIENNNIICGLDIFASSFFMLTRWEEAVISEKDKHSRFKCEISLAQKHNFSHRAIVNEYVEMLWNMLKYLGCEQKRKLRKFEIIPTHDIDFLQLFDTYFNGLKVIGGDILKRGNISMALNSLKSFLGYKFGKTNDPYDTFDFLMDISEKNNVKSNFYFIAGKKGEADVRYNFISDKVKKTIKNIQQRGHNIGIHGGYSSFDNLEQFQKEINRFRKFNLEISEGRQHYLRFENPKTWQIWEKSEMKYDSTIGYANGSGFRAGTCYEYSVFDIIERKKLNLIERPLIFMETVSKTKYPNKDDFTKHCLSLKNTVKKYNGQFVFLWHNSNFNTYLWEDIQDFYPKIFSQGKNYIK